MVIRSLYSLLRVCALCGVSIVAQQTEREGKQNDRKVETESAKSSDVRDGAEYIEKQQELEKQERQQAQLERKYVEEQRVELKVPIARTRDDDSSDDATLRIGFGSCQTMWSAYCKENREPDTKDKMVGCSKMNVELDELHAELMKRPLDYWIWLGDAYYADTMMRPGKFLKADPTILQERSTEIRKYPPYQEFLQKLEARRKQSSSGSGTTTTPTVMGIYDDHDFGINDGDHNYEWRSHAQMAFANFLEDPSLLKENSGHDGIYKAHSIEIPLLSSGKVFKIRILLLDNRYFKSPDDWILNKVIDPFDNNEGKTLLGEEQFRWLEKEFLNISKETTDLVLVGSGVQFLPLYHASECWLQYPNDRNRLRTLIKGIEGKTTYPPVILSGDIHFGEAFSYRENRFSNKKTPLLYEFTSSGLTHSFGEMKLWVRSGLQVTFGGAFLGDVVVRFFLDRLFPAYKRWMVLRDGEEIFFERIVQEILDLVRDAITKPFKWMELLNSLSTTTTSTDGLLTTFVTSGFNALFARPITFLHRLAVGPLQGVLLGKGHNYNRLTLYGTRHWAELAINQKTGAVSVEYRGVPTGEKVYSIELEKSDISTSLGIASDDLPMERKRPMLISVLAISSAIDMLAPLILWVLIIYELLLGNKGLWPIKLGRITLDCMNRMRKKLGIKGELFPVSPTKEGLTQKGQKSSGNQEGSSMSASATGMRAARAIARSRSRSPRDSTSLRMGVMSSPRAKSPTSRTMKTSGGSPGSIVKRNPGRPISASSLMKPGFSSPIGGWEIDPSWSPQLAKFHITTYVISMILCFSSEVGSLWHLILLHLYFYVLVGRRVYDKIVKLLTPMDCGSRSVRFEYDNDGGGTKWHILSSLVGIGGRNGNSQKSVRNTSPNAPHSPNKKRK